MTSTDLDLGKYKLGWSDEEDYVFKPKKGLNESIVREMSAMKKEPEWMRDFRLRALQRFERRPMAAWFAVNMPDLDFDDIYYYIKPTSGQVEDWNDLPDAIKNTYERLGIPEAERKYLAGVTAQYESEVVFHRNREDLEQLGVLFCDMDTAVREHPDLVRKYLGSVVPSSDNFYAALNSAVFTDGSFCFIPKGVTCPMDLSTYFRINNKESGQFERTLIVAEEGASVSYLEGCTAPQFDVNQLHAAVVELVALDDASIKYSTVQNWYAGDKDGVGGIFNFVTKRGLCKGRNSKISWTQVETGSAITWKYPSCVLLGDNSVGEFYSVALTNHRQQADTGTKMLHIGRNTKSTIISKGISAGYSANSYRGLVRVVPRAEGARNFSQCDSMLIGSHCSANTFPYIEVQNVSAKVEHEATTSKIGEEQLFYFQQRGIPPEDAISMIINGFCKEVFRELPMEFAVEATRLLSLKLEGSVG